MNGYYLLLLGTHNTSLLYASDLSLCCHLEIVRIHHLFVVSSCQESCFIAKIGDISPVVRSDFGYHLLLLTGDQRGLDFHKEAIRTLLIQKRMKAIVDNEIAKLRKKRKIQIYEDNLSKLSPLPDVIK